MFFLTINIVLATGKIGAPGKGYGTITGQGNGQGGREHGQKADQLPGQRSMLNPEHRKYVCDVWCLPEEELPEPGVSVVEMFQKMREGEIKGFFSLCNNGMVSLPDTNKICQSLEDLEFNVNVDFFMSEASQKCPCSDAVLNANPHLQGVLFDLPPVFAGAQALLENENVIDQYRTTKFSFFLPFAAREIFSSVSCAPYSKLGGSAPSANEISPFIINKTSIKIRVITRLQTKK